MTRHVSEAFAIAKSENRAALIGYLPAGFPNPELSVKLINAMVTSGVDIIEVGLPYSDPLMDGPVIQQAVDQALAAGTTTDVVLDIVKQVVDAGISSLFLIQLFLSNIKCCFYTLNVINGLFCNVRHKNSLQVYPTMSRTHSLI